MTDEFQNLRRYWRLCLITLFVWLIFDLTPGPRSVPVVFASLNLMALFMVLPAFLDIYSRKLLGERKYALSNFFITPAVMIGEAMNLIPGNPYAAGLPYFLQMQALTLNKMEEGKEGEKVARRLLRYYESQKQVHPMRLAHTTVMLGTALSQQGKFEESEKMTRSAIAIFETAPGVRPVKIAASLADLCVALSKEGKAKESLDVGNRALHIMESSQTNDRNDLVLLGMTLNNLAVAYNYAGNPAKALELYERSLKLKLMIFGENSKEAVIGFNNVGFAILQQEQYERAVENLEKAKKIMIDLNMKQSRMWPNILCNCGDVHRGLGRLDEAEKELLEALRIHEQEKGSKDIQESWHCLGKLYRDKGDYAKSESFFKKAIADREKQYGRDHYKVGQSLKEYSKMLRLTQRESEAEQLDSRVAVIGENLAR